MVLGPAKEKVQGGKLLFHYPILNRGGAERSLLRLMARLLDRGCEVHLVLTNPGGVLEPEVDPRIRIHHLRKIHLRNLTNSSYLHRMIWLPIRLFHWGLAKIQEYFQRKRFAGMKFDASFAGLTGLSPEFICSVVDARRRFVFVRNDPALADKKGRWAANIRKFHEHIDAYLCVSGYVRDAMAARFPEVADKSVCVYNVLDAQAMRCKAGVHPSPFERHDRSRICVLSVCRLQEASKGLLRMVEVHRRLLDAGIAHDWHVLGDGPDRALLERAIAEHHVGGTFILHGAVSNPFPWYAHADLVAVLSRYEGLCGVVNEARVMGRPVIATRFSAIDEQIKDGVSGLIVDQDVNAIVAGMKRLLLDADLRDALSAGGLPDEIMNDEAKLNRLIRLISA